MPLELRHRLFERHHLDVVTHGGTVSQHLSLQDLAHGSSFGEEDTLTVYLLILAYLPFRATDSASQTAHGEVFFKVTPLDACTVPSCNPATGCTADIVPLTEDCCDGPLPDRIPEPSIPCPEGRVVYVGANIDGFGRLQNCDRLRFDVAGGQTAPTLRFRVAARCLNTDSPITITAQLSTRTRANVLNRITTIILVPRPDGFAYGVTIFPLQVIGFDLEDAEGTLRIRLTDADQETTSNAFRFILTSALLDDQPDVDDSGPPPPTAPCGDSPESPTAQYPAALRSGPKT